MSQVQKQIEQLLSPLKAEVFEFQDDSHLHIGHAGHKKGGHYSILVVSSIFENQSRLQRQRSIQELLAPMFANQQIHALSIRAQTPQEYFN